MSATVHCFLENCHLPASLRMKGTLKPEEIVTSEIHLIRLTEQEDFQEEICTMKSGGELPGNSKLLPLKPVYDKDRIFR